MGGPALHGRVWGCPISGPRPCFISALVPPPHTGAAVTLPLPEHLAGHQSWRLNLTHAFDHGFSKLGACWWDLTSLFRGLGWGWSQCNGTAAFADGEVDTPYPGRHRLSVSPAVLLEGSSSTFEGRRLRFERWLEPLLDLRQDRQPAHRPCRATKAVSFQTSAAALKYSDKPGPYAAALAAPMRRCRVDPQWGWPKRQIRRASRPASRGWTPRCRSRLIASTARLQTLASRRQDETRIPKPSDVFLPLLQ
jgi:hypothetical protein